MVVGLTDWSRLDRAVTRRTVTCRRSGQPLPKVTWTVRSLPVLLAK